ncbi:hypothetical protein FQN54_002197 [Arachnomyces sp. PD_36]|nr:hypothetical protein FQN54_002197 [Arachnomyces sp. PD_36]
MDKHRTNALQYGHLGTAIYDSNAQSWDFARDIEKDSAPSLIGRSEVAIPPSMNRSNQDVTSNRSSQRTRQTANLIKACPELASSSKYISGTEVRSQVITTATDTFDPRVSNLLALGNATFVEGNRVDNRTVPIAVSAWGDSASSLKLVPIEDKLMEGISPNIHRANVPCITDRESGWWTETGSSVRQISFSDSAEEASTWMVVRFPQSTRIFRPLCHRAPVPAGYADTESVHGIFPNSRLEANPLVNIPISLTGNYPHADVKINPWYQRQTAIVDEQGNWSVWEVHGRHGQKNKYNWRADRTHFGHLPRPDSEGQEISSEHEHFDGWALITWVGEAGNLLVCDRRNAVLYSIGSDSIKLCRVDLDLERNSEWILHLEKSPSNESHIFVLTSSKIFWLDMASQESLHREGDDRIEVTVLMSWRHFRGLEDTSLRFTLLKSGEDISLTLYSRLNHLVQTFRYSFSPKNKSRPISSSDPSSLPLPSELEPEDGHGARILSLQFHDVDDVITSRPDDTPQNSKLVKMFLQQTDLSVVEALYSLSIEDYQQDSIIIQEKRPTVSLRKIKKGRGIGQTDDDLGDFVVDDWDESTFTSGVGQYGRLRNARFSISSLQKINLEDPWIVNFNSMYSAITQNIGFAEETNDFNASVEAIKLSLQGSEPLNMAVSPSLLDIAAANPSLNDIDLNAREFQIFLGYLHNEETDPMGHYRSFQVKTVYPFRQLENTLLGTDASSQPSITLLYDSLIHDWLATLPSDVPNKTRMEKEKLIRSVAAELSLARVVIFRKPATQLNSQIFPEPMISLTDDVKLSTHSQSDEHTIEAGHTRSSSQPTISQDSKPSSTQIEGTPGLPRSEPSSPFPSSFPSTQVSQPGGTHSPTSILRLYTTVNEQPSLSREAANILSHWQISSDPTAYDWQKTSQTLEAEEAEHGRLSRASSSSKRKKREARKRMALQQTIEQSGLPSDPVAGPSSSVPGVTRLGSQTLGGSSTLGFPQSSQVTAGFPSSQFELGGLSQQSRAGNKGKPKKKRAAGF